MHLGPQQQTNLFSEKILNCYLEIQSRATKCQTLCGFE